MIGPAVQSPSLTVLVVDDEELMRRFLKRTLTEDGYAVLLATNGLEALTYFEQHSPSIHLVITDVQMPRMSGIELAARLAALPCPPSVVFMSGSHGMADLPGVLLRKPFLRDELSAVMQRTLDGSTRIPMMALP